MTRVVTGAALVGLAQGVVLTLLLGFAVQDTGWFAYTPLADARHTDRSAWIVTTVPPLLAASAAAVAQRLGWLGPRPDRGHALAGRLGAAAVALAVAAQVVAPPAPPERRYADYLPVDQTDPSWVVVGAAVAAAAVLVVLAALREHRVWARPALAVVLVLGLAGVVAQVVLLDGLVLAALVGEVLALLLGGTALALARR